MQSRKFIDQMGREVTITYPPKRIVSLVPSQTELLFDLGLDEEVVGLTKFCIHPESKVKSKTKIGGTKDFKIDRILALKPDLVIGNKEENEQLKIEELQKHLPVWMSDIKGLNDALKMVTQVGDLVGKSEEANLFSNQIKTSFEGLVLPPNSKSIRALYLIWKSPYMAAGKDTFIHEMMAHCGLQNLTPDSSRYPELGEEDLIKLRPDLILLSSEPYPFKDKHIEELSALVPTAKVILVDGEMFSWYGSRLRHSASYFHQLLSIL